MKSMESKQIAPLFLMTLLFGMSFIATKQALTGLGIFQVVFARHFLALVVLSLFLWRRPRRLVIAPQDRKHFLVLTVVEPVGYFIFETYGIRYTTPSSVSIIIATIPVFSLLFALWLLRENTHWLAVAGIGLSLLGVYFIVSTQQTSELAPYPLAGNFLTLGAAVTAGLYNVLCRRLTRRYSAWTITYYQAIAASLFFLPFASAEGFLYSGWFIDRTVVFSILYLGLGSSVVAYYLLNYSLSRLPTYKVAIFANLIPVVTIFASWIVYTEILDRHQWLGALLVILGIYLTYYRRKKKSVSHH